METLRLILLFLHLVGFALLLGGGVAQYLSGTVRINRAMLWGAGAQLVTGLALSAPLGRENDLNPVKLGVKFVIAVMIFVMVFFSRKRTVVSSGHFLAIIGLTVANAGVAVFWH